MSVAGHYAELTGHELDLDHVTNFGERFAALKIIPSP